MRAGFEADSSETPIILFDDVSKISVSEVFKDLLGVLENRGPNFPVKISLGKTYFCLKTGLLIFSRNILVPSI